MAKRILSVIVVLAVGFVLIQLGIPRRVIGLMSVLAIGWLLSRSSPYEPSVRDLLQSSEQETHSAQVTPRRDENGV